MIYRFVIFVFGWVLVFVHISHSQDNIISFYPKAYAKTQNPPEEKKLIIIAEQKIEDKFVTFIGVEKGKVLLAAITKEKINNLQKSISLKVRFKNKKISMGQYTMTFGDVPVAGELKDWGYIYDRNADGKLDYVSFFIGVMPVKQKDFPTDFPKGLVLLPFHDNPKHLEIFKRSCQLIFNHMADDNLDGSIDGVVLERMDHERSWVDSWTIIQNSKFKETVDTCWIFKDNVGIKEGDCVKTQKGYMVRRATKDSTEFDTKEQANLAKELPLYKTKFSEFGSTDMTKMYELLSLFNQAASLCGLTKDSFYKE